MRSSVCLILLVCCATIARGDSDIFEDGTSQDKGVHSYKRHRGGEEPVEEASPAQPLKPASESQAEGDKLIKDGKFAEAIRAYSAAVDAAPDDYLNYYKRATAYLAKRLTANALSDLNRVLDKKADFVQARVRRGKTLLSLGRFAEADSDFREVLRIKPTESIAKAQIPIAERCAALMRSADELLRSQRWAEARDQLSAVLDLAPDAINVRLQRAECNEHLGDFNAIIDDTMRVLKLESTNVEALFGRGRAFYLLGEPDAAMNHYREALRHDPDNVKLSREYKKLKKFEKLLKEANDAANNGRAEEALTAYRAALETDPTHPTQQANLHLRQCDMLLQLRRGREAIEACTRSHEMQPDALEPIIQIAEAYLQLEEYERGVQWFNKAQTKGQHDRRVIEGMQRAQRLLKIATRKNYYQILGVTKQASAQEIRKAYRKLALEWHPDKHHGEAKEAAEKRFIEVSEAHDILSDEDKRRRYDNGEDVENPQPQHQHHGFPFGFGGGGHGGQGFQFHFHHG
eukprot:TRINITY_DN8367_c0_g1_i1.p1 TRINITY_DN8367_c0_g1~~TRINITY_DN8367_c0_g1_i1.p1  ORF type:complete len:516 (-),score=167.89 TRINITY_DN8367_c0_g1_i1:233-1780(-)